MKNIHVLQTDKSSRLWLTKLGNLTRCHDIKPIKEALGNNVNIYITSDEEIKEGDWILDKFKQKWKLEKQKLIAFDSRGIKRFSTDNIVGHECKKIILTTDQDLIGVQAIDDEFLEWFVKNPSCEEVEVEKGYAFGTFYKIIIPKEEPKKNFYCGDEVDYDDKCLEQCDRCVDATGVDYGYLPEEHVELINKNIEEFDKKVNEQKQNIINMMKGDEELGLYDETLEEAAIDYCDRFFGKDRTTHQWNNGYTTFINSAKWQQEKSYSDEEVNEMFDTLKRNAIDNVATISNVDLFINSWKQQFKKR